VCVCKRPSRSAYLKEVMINEKCKTNVARSRNKREKDKRKLLYLRKLLVAKRAYRRWQTNEI
jgi:hypothetical protein